MIEKIRMTGLAVVGSVTWLALLVATGYSGVTVALGLLVVLTVAGREKRSHA